MCCFHIHYSTYCLPMSSETCAAQMRQKIVAYDCVTECFVNALVIPLLLNEPPVASEFSIVVQTSGSSGSASFAPFSSLTRVLHLYFVPRGTSQHFLWLAHFLSKFCWTTDAWPTFGAPPTRRGQTVFASKIILFSLCEIIV